LACLEILLAVALASPPRLEWLPATQRLLAPNATYGRMKRLADGAVLCCFERDGRSWVMRSEDDATTWSTPLAAGVCAGAVAANPDLCPLRGGGVLLMFNQRPIAGGNVPFAIRVSTSRDGGRTWQTRGEPVYTAGTTRDQACWEPAAVQMPDGEVRLFFSHELSGAQEIAVTTSRDEGETWTPARRVSLRPGHRDGMPAPLLLADGRLVVAIEDNGLAAPQFRPTILDIDDNDAIGADSPRRRPALAEPPRAGANLAAPYLARLTTGEVLLSVQSNEDDARWHRPAVYVGDAQARNFGGRTLPFGLAEADGKWNSLFVKDADTVLALSHTIVGGRRGLWCVEGRVVRDEP
jgi:hypothetical protein